MAGRHRATARKDHHLENVVPQHEVFTIWSHEKEFQQQNLIFSFKLPLAFIDKKLNETNNIERTAACYIAIHTRANSILFYSIFQHDTACCYTQKPTVSLSLLKCIITIEQRWDN